MKLFVIFVIATFFSLLECARFKDCGSAKGTPIEVDVQNCGATDTTCILKKGTDVGVTVRFTSKEAADQLTAVVHGIIAGLPVPFKVPQVNACEKSNITCPLKANTEYYYHQTIPVSTSYPSLSLSVKWELQNPAKEDVICIEIGVKVQSAASLALAKRRHAIIARRWREILFK